MRRAIALIALGLLVAVAAAGCGSSSTASSSSTPSAAASTSTSTPAAPSATSSATTPASSGQQLGFEGVPVETGPALGSAGTTGTGVVDGITCAPLEQLTYHVHAHLAVFVDGRPYSLPAGIGIPGSVAEQTPQGPVALGGRCYYWLHTHSSDGVIHIESPTARIYSLGDFFDEWHQPLSATQVAAVHGQITALVNDRPWRRSLRAIPLIPHEDIQFDVGRPAPAPAPISVNWSQTGL